MALNDDIVARATADLQRALERAASARDQLLAAESEASDLQAFLRTLERYTKAAPDGETAEHAGNTLRTPAKAGTRARDLVDTCIVAIKDAGHPLKIGDLTDIVLAAGLTLGGQDQKSNLAGYLSRDPRVVTRGRSIGWDLVENEEAATVPASDEAASSSIEGGTDERSTLTGPDDIDDLLG